MNVDPGPYKLDLTRLILAPDSSVTPKNTSPTFYEELDAEFDQFRGHVLVQTAEFAEAWPCWEVHPHGDEIVYLLSGDTEFVLRQNDADTVLRINDPGSAIVVPRGCWHTARPLAPTQLLFITPGEGTINAEQPTD